MTKEANIQKQIMMALSEAGAIVWRNNTGVLKDNRGRPVKFGLCVGSSDLIGICPDGRFLAVEVKAAKGKATDAQDRFISAVRRMGGRAGVARSAQEALDILAHSV